jgi:hypothetical protein
MLPGVLYVNLKNIIFGFDVESFFTLNKLKIKTYEIRTDFR